MDTIIDLTESDDLVACEVCKDALAVTEVKGTCACRSCGDKLQQQHLARIARRNAETRAILRGRMGW